MYGREAKVIGELVFLEVGEYDGCEGGEKRGAFVYGAVVYGVPYRLGASFEYGGAIEVLVVFYGVAVLDDAFGATESRRGAETVRGAGMESSVKTYSSEVRALGCICTRIDRDECSPGRTSYKPSTLRAESSSLSWLILICARAA